MNISEIKQKWTVIKNEILDRHNTAVRVGTAGEAIVEKLSEVMTEVYDLSQDINNLNYTSIFD
jgi:hypothetical protein